MRCPRALSFVFVLAAMFAAACCSKPEEKPAIQQQKPASVEPSKPLTTQDLLKQIATLQCQLKHENWLELSAEEQERLVQAQLAETLAAPPTTVSPAELPEIKSRGTDVTCLETELQKAAEKFTDSLPAGATVFKSSDGSYVVEGPSGLAEPLYVSPDGKHFYEVHQDGYGGSNDEHHISFENPHDNTQGEFNREENKLTMNGKVYERTDAPTNIRLIAMPEVRQVEYLFSMPDGRFVCVTADKYRYAYETFHLFIGTKDKMEQAKITGMVSRYRDGGTTYVPTDKGVLWSPSGFERLEPKWKPEPFKGEYHADESKEYWADAITLKREPHDRFTVMEKNGALTITENK